MVYPIYLQKSSMIWVFLSNNIRIHFSQTSNKVTACVLEPHPPLNHCIRVRWLHVLVCQLIWYKLSYSSSTSSAMSYLRALYYEPRWTHYVFIYLHVFPGLCVQVDTKFCEIRSMIKYFHQLYSGNTSHIPCSVGSQFVYFLSIERFDWPFYFILRVDEPVEKYFI